MNNPESLAYVLSDSCTGPNAACRAAHRAGRSVHVIDREATVGDAPNDRGRLIMPSWHFATAEEGIAAVSAAAVSAMPATSDEEWLRLEAERRVPFRTRPGMRHPTRR